MELSAIALGGLNQAQTKLEQTAKRLASIGAPSNDGLPTDSVDLSTEMVSLLSAKNEFATNIKTLQAADEITRQTIDLLA